jgi:putative ABC transport system ATP-binding protein
MGCALDSVVVEHRSLGATVRAVDGISVDIAPGSFTVLAGPSGSGKSTLIRLLAGFDEPASGSVHVDGLPLAHIGERRRRRLRRRSLAVIHQRPLSNLSADLTAAQHIRFARQVRRSSNRPPATTPNPLRTVGLEHRADAAPWQLSGGEQQRLAVALAMVGDVRLVLADEPTAELDGKHSAAVVDALAALCAHGRTVVVASHDSDVIGRATQLVRLADGRRCG